MAASTNQAMKTTKRLTLIKIPAFLSLLAVVGCPWPMAFAQGTAFTYQGRLNDSGSPANGAYDFRFRLAFDPLANNYAGTYFTNGVVVSNGLFTTALDFGPGIFVGTNYWLEVDVRTNSGGTYATLNPLQPVTPTPYAVFAASSSNLTGVLPASQLSGPIPNGNMPASPSFTGTVTANSLTGNGANVTNVNALTLNGLAAGNFWQLGGNNVGATQFIGSTNNQPIAIGVAGMAALRILPTANDMDHSNIVNVIGGSPANTVPPGVYGATISGGGASYYYGPGGGNTVMTNFGTVAGGFGNIVNGLYSVVSGGSQNTNGADSSVVGGGNNNTITLNGGFSFIGGGYNNSNSGQYAIIGGGYENSASGTASFVGGGGFNGLTAAGNSASGIDSVATGGLANHSSGNSATIGGGINNTASGASSVIAGGGIGGQGNEAEGDYSAIGGGVGNENFGLACTIGGGYQNSVGNPYATVSGGLGNHAAGFCAVIAGGGGTLVGGVISGSVSGGNTAIGDYSTIPGGSNNVASGTFSFAAGQQARAVHGGTFVWADSQNAAFKSTTNDQFLIRAQGGVGINTGTTIAGGFTLNTNMYLSGYAFYLRGLDESGVNQIDHNHGLAYCGQGETNFAPNVTPNGPVLWGFSGGALGEMSGGAQVDLAWTNSSVGIGTNSPSAKLHITSSGNQSNPQLRLDQTATGDYARIRMISGTTPGVWDIAAGGSGTSVMNFFVAPTIGATGTNILQLLPTGNAVLAGTLSQSSDRARKENIKAINPEKMLAKVSELPISEWNYISEPGVEHVGPMAQDFYAAFNVGADDKHITTVDEGGVALAAIQGLDEKLEGRSQKAEAGIQKLEAENAELRQRLEALEKLLQKSQAGNSDRESTRMGFVDGLKRRGARKFF